MWDCEDRELDRDALPWSDCPTVVRDLELVCDWLRAWPATGRRSPVAEMASIMIKSFVAPLIEGVGMCQQSFLHIVSMKAINESTRLVGGFLTHQPINRSHIQHCRAYPSIAIHHHQFGSHHRTSYRIVIGV